MGIIYSNPKEEDLKKMTIKDLKNLVQTNHTAKEYLSASHLARYTKETYIAALIHSKRIKK